MNDISRPGSQCPEIKRKANIGRKNDREIAVKLSDFCVIKFM